MCGITGVIDYHGRTNKISTLESMLRSISYRGPDESGIYHSEFATLGSVRLSIIDLQKGQQPLSDPSGRYWIVYNGEIFNYRELRAELSKKDCRFNTHSDTEVIVQLYSLYGESILQMLNGQFAFAIWDNLNEELFLARDRVGIRPLFYNITLGVLSFASEVKSLLRQNTISREINPESLSQIYTYWAALTPNTAFTDIHELSPGSYLKLNRKGLKTTKYWSLDFGKQLSAMSLSDAMEQLNDLLSSAARLRLRADVEVAAYLSGGIDSTSTVKFIKDLEPGILNTFSIGFEEKDFDESRYQNEAIKYLDTNHKTIICSSADIAEFFPKMVWHSEIPLLRTAPVPMMMLAGLVRQNNIKVVITGEGADEMLAGYDIFREAVIRRFWASQPGSSLRPLLLKKIYSDIPHLRDASPNMLKMFFGYKLEETDDPFYSHILRWNNSNHIKRCFSPEIKDHLSEYSPFDDLSKFLPRNFDSYDPLAKAQWLESTIFMSGYLLSSQGDRMAMANSVEGRYPFLDHRVIEFCTSLPAGFKLKGLNEKYLLKKVMENRIPDSIIKRPKQPYRAPISSVFLSKDAPEYVQNMLSDNYTKKAGIFDHKAIFALLKKIERTGLASEVDNMTLTAIISTHLLHHQFIEGNNEEFQGGELKNLKIIEDKKE